MMMIMMMIMIMIMMIMMRSEEEDVDEDDEDDIRQKQPTWVSVSVVGSVGGELDVLGEAGSVLSDDENSAD